MIQLTSATDFSSPFHHGIDNCIRQVQCRDRRSSNSVGPYCGFSRRHGLQVVAKIKIFLFKIDVKDVLMSISLVLRTCFPLQDEGLTLSLCLYLWFFLLLVLHALPYSPG